ncbi:MAG: TadE family protein [Bryobacteraceae bacterium]
MPVTNVVGRSRTRRQRGQALVESALVMLIFLSFLIGTLDFGQFLFFHQSLVERARAAARYAAVNPTDATGTKNIAVYNTAVPALDATPMVGGLTTSMVGVVSSDIGLPEARITVTITGYPFSFLSPYIAGSYTAKPIRAVMASEAP